MNVTDAISQCYQIGSFLIGDNCAKGRVINIGTAKGGEGFYVGSAKEVSLFNNRKDLKGTPV